MPDLIFRRTQSGYYNLFADMTQRSCGEIRKELTYIAGGYTTAEAKRFVDLRIASWEYGSEPKPEVCPTCGRKTERE